MTTNRRVPTVAPDDTVLMPTKASRARRWLQAGKAEVVPNDLKIFQIRLLFEPSGTDTQPIALGIDPGSMFSGIAVQSENETLFTGHLVLPFKGVRKRMTERRTLRRKRRGQRIDRSIPFQARAHRQKRFDNRRREKLAPSIRSNREFELRVTHELQALFPLSSIVYEVVTYRPEKGKTNGFSAVMVGQKRMVEWLSKKTIVLKKKGWETSNLRKYLGLTKDKENKSRQTPETHANDAIALACNQFIRYAPHGTGYIWKGDVTVTDAPFRVISRPQYFRRALHFTNTLKGGNKKRKGGTVTPFGFRAGDYVMAEKAGTIYTGWLGGFTHTKKTKNIAVYDLNWKRLGQFSPKKTTLIQRNNGLCVQANA